MYGFKIKLSRHAKIDDSNDDGFIDEMSSYFADYIFRKMGCDKDDEIEIGRVKDIIL